MNECGCLCHSNVLLGYEGCCDDSEVQQWIEHPHGPLTHVHYVRLIDGKVEEHDHR